MSHAIDLSVAIERVRVRTRVLGDRPPPPSFVAGYLGTSSAAPHDHRIVIRELCIDVEAELDAASARGLGARLAARLAEELAALQHDRALRLADRAVTARPIQVERLGVYLRGELVRHPPNEQITAALLGALAESIRDAG